MTQIDRIHFILYVRDQAVSTAFYERVLGRVPTLDVPGMTEFCLGDTVVLGLMPERGIVGLLALTSDSVPARSLRGEVYLVVGEPEAYHSRAVSAGARELSPLRARDWGHDVAYSQDADGYVLAFARPSKPQP